MCDSNWSADRGPNAGERLVFDRIPTEEEIAQLAEGEETPADRTPWWLDAKSPGSRIASTVFRGLCFGLIIGGLWNWFISFLFE